MDKDDKTLNEIYSKVKDTIDMENIALSNGSDYPMTKWGPDREHTVIFEDEDNQEVKDFFEGKEHLVEIYPGVTKGMLVNFSVNGALFDPFAQMPSEMKTNYEALAKAMSEKGFSYSKMVDKLSEFDINEYGVTELTERAYLNSEAFRMRACRSLGYDSVQQMPPDIKQTYDSIVQRAQDSSEYLKVIRNVGDMPSFYSNSQELVDAAEKTINDGEVEDDVIDAVEMTIDDVRSLYVGGKMDSKDGIVFININQTKDVGIDAMTHEMAHFLYNKDNLSPGVHEKNNEYKGDIHSFGKEKSPLNEIDKQKIKYNLAYLINITGGSMTIANMLMNPKTQEEREILKEEKAHDNAGVERGADIHGVRMMMFKEGIYNPFDGSDVTPEQVGKFMEAHPNSRIFRYWNEKQSRFFLNNIAFNESLRETVGKNILAAIDEDDKEINAMRGNSFGKGVDASSVTAANMAASSFQQIYDENIGKGLQESKGLSV